jgi:DNA repair protein RecN (Recombination protein N)
VDEVEAELRPGLTVLTGETGAGKSILVDALGLALGNRADSDAVRPGAERAEITATFSTIGNQNVNQWLKDNDLDESTSGDGTECVLRRVVTADGRSRGYINGNSVPMHLLREVGGLLVDICGQQAHQSLGQAENQRILLDQHGDHLSLVEEHRNAWREWQALQQEYDKLHAASTDQATRIDLLRFQVHELDALDARPGELSELEQSHRIAANASRIHQNAGAALQMLYDNEQVSAYDLASKARSYLDELSELDPSLGTLAAQLTEAEIIMSEAADSLRRYLDRDSPDAANLAGLENRLAAMQDMARKHRITAAELPELTIRLHNELQRLEHSDDALDELRQAIATRFVLLQALGAKLTSARQRAAKSLSKEVTRNIQQLGMSAGKFSVNLETRDRAHRVSRRAQSRYSCGPAK